MALSKRLRFEILRRDAHTCRYCGRTAPEVRLTVDHVVPSALGGGDDPANLVTACSDCNAGKSSATADAAKVEAAAESAIRWSEAIRMAAERRAVEREAVDREVDEFAGEWDSFKYEVSKTVYVDETYPKPANWRDSIERFLQLGLSVDDLSRATKIAIGNTRIYSRDKWAYFCGVCWKEIERLQEVAAQIADQEKAASEREHPGESRIADVP